MRETNENGIALIKQWEGLRLSAYDDGGGVLTIGYGHTSAAGDPRVTRGLRITEDEAETILRRDLRGAERDVERLVKVPLTDNQFAALVSFVFNVGPTAFAKSTLLRKLNSGNYAAVPTELMRWVNDNGRKVKGLVNRRAAECGLWAKGDFVSSNTVPAQKEKPPILSPEVIAVGTSIVTGAGSKLVEGNGPIQWALAVVMVAAGLAALGLFIKSRIADR